MAKGYDVNYAWGIGVHSHDMGGAMLPEMMRWLWRDHPVSVDPNDTIERSFRTGKSAAAFRGSAARSESGRGTLKQRH